MKSLQREAAFELWDQWWGELQDEWFKIEVLQNYAGEDSGPSLNAWLTGERETSVALMADEMEEWIDMCRTSPARKRRFRIVTEPKTPYTEWEIELYRQVNIPQSGESVHLVSAKAAQELAIPDGDVMIFDQKRVARAHYSDDGRVISMDFYEKTDDIDEFLRLRSQLQKIGIQLQPNQARKNRP